MWWLFIVTQEKLHVPVDSDRVLNLHNGRDMAAGSQHSATLLPFMPVAKKYSQESYGFYESLPAAWEVPVRSRTSIILCADNPFSFYSSTQTKPYPCRQEGRRFEGRPHFLANSISLCQMTHSLGSFSSHNDGSEVVQGSMHLHCFSACSSWPTVWILNTVLTWLTLTHPFWLQPLSWWAIFKSAFAVRHATAHMLPAPPSPPLLSASATPWFACASIPSANFFARPQASSRVLLDFDLRETFFCRPSSRILFFGTRTTVSPFLGQLQHGLTFRRLPSQPSHFSLAVSGPYSPVQI